MFHITKKNWVDRDCSGGFFVRVFIGKKMHQCILINTHWCILMKHAPVDFLVTYTSAHTQSKSIGALKNITH
jgi:hypothetical protein